MNYSSDLISRSKIHKRLDLGFSGLGKFIWISQSLVMFSSLGFFCLRLCSRPRQVCKILHRTEPRADLRMYFVLSCTSSEEPEHCSIVTVPVLILLFDDCGSITQLLLALQV